MPNVSRLSVLTLGLILACGGAQKEQPAPAQPAAAESDAPLALVPEQESPVVAADQDGDGVADAQDACPKQRGESARDATQNGCPKGPRDTDEDGLADEKDSCPREATSSKGGASDGCPGAGPAEATFAGFRAAPDGSSIVFVQLTDSVRVEVTERPGEVSYLMKGAVVLIRNNKNPLLAGEFGAAVKRAQLVSEKEGVRLVVVLAAAEKPSYRLVRHGGGAELQVDVLPAAQNP